MLAAIDMGSNSFRLHIGRFENGTIHVVKSAREPNRLAAGLDQNNELSVASMQAGVDALLRLKNILNAYPLDAVRAVATNTLRVAKNAPDFIKKAERALGYPIEIISGEEEGRLIYMGVSSVIEETRKHVLVVDIGGGSTELILGLGENIDRVESFSIGTVNQSLLFFPEGDISHAGFGAAILSARSHFEDAAIYYRAKNWGTAYGSSGTIRAISEIISRNGIGKLDLSIDSLIALKNSMVQHGNFSRMKYSGMKADRTASVVGGLAVLIALMQELRIAEITPIEAGLRMGVMWDLHLRATSHDRRDQSVRYFLRRFHAEESRADCVAKDAMALFLEMRPETDAYGKHLYWSALLHEVGQSVSPTNAHKHGAYLVENADLAGFTSREQRKMSKLVLGQKGNLKKLNAILDDVDAVKAVLSLRLAVMLMHARVALDHKMFKLRLRNRIELEVKDLWVERHPTLSYWLQRECDYWKEIGVEVSIKFAS